MLNLQGIRKPAFYAYKFLAQICPKDVSTSDAARSWAMVRSHGPVQVLLCDDTPIAPPAGSTNQAILKKEQPMVPLRGQRLAIEHLRGGSCRLEIFRAG